MQRETIAACDGLEIAEHRVSPHRADALDAAVGDGAFAVGNDLGQIDGGDVAQAAAMRAGALRRIERESIGGGDIKRKARVGTHEVAAEMLQLVVCERKHGNGALALVHRAGHGILDALAVFFPGHQLVHDQFHKVDLVAVQRPGFTQVGQLPVDPHLRESFPLQLRKEFPVVAFAPADQRRQQEHFLPLVALQDQVDDLVVGIAHHLFAAFRREGLGGAGIKQAEEVVDFGDGAHRGAGIAAHRLLLDGDHGAQAFHLVDVGTFQDADELAGVGRQGIHVAALPFGADRIESQRRLAAARQAGDDHQAVAGNLQVDVLEVVDPGSGYRDLLALSHVMRLAGRDWWPVRSRWKCCRHGQGKRWCCRQAAGSSESGCRSAGRNCRRDGRSARCCRQTACHR